MQRSKLLGRVPVGVPGWERMYTTASFGLCVSTGRLVAVMLRNIAYRRGSLHLLALLRRLGWLAPAALIIVESTPATEVLDAVGFCVLFERSGNLYRRHWLAPSATTRFGLPGSLEFWLNASHEDGLEWWLPTASEARERAAEVRDALQRQRVADAGAVVY